jgi:mono/diheme cytochrome c family protein
MRLRMADCGLRIGRAGWATVLLWACVGCGKPDPANRYRRPEQVLDFGQLYAQNCSGCHGASGRLGPAPPLADPLFLAIISDDELREVIAAGRPGTPMTAFDRQHGGLLTTEQIVALIDGLRREWGASGSTHGKLPSYRGEPGEAGRGRKVFSAKCANCHGDDGKGGMAGAVHDRAFLQLISDQALRRIVITGRTDLGMPGCAEWKQPVNEQDIADVVALLASWRGQSGNE